MGLALLGQDVAQGLLGAGLADRAGHRDDLGAASGRGRRRRGASIAVRTGRRRYGTQRRAVRRAARRRGPRRTTAAPAPRPRASATKSWPSRVSPRMAKNRSPGWSVRVSIEAPPIGRSAPIRRPPVRGFELLAGPECGHDRPPSPSGGRVGDARRAGPRGPRTAGCDPPRSGRFHDPCRRRPARRRARARRTARPDRLGPVADLLGARGRGQDRRRIAAGSSVRGLSSVTMTVSASRCAMAPISGRLPRSRSPPQPNTTTSRPDAKGRSARQHAFQRLGLVGVVDEDRGRPAPRRSAPCGRARRRDGPERANTPSGSAAPVAMAEAGRDQGVLDLELADERQPQRRGRGRRRRAGRACANPSVRTRLDAQIPAGAADRADAAARRLRRRRSPGRA